MTQSILLSLLTLAVLGCGNGPERAGGAAAADTVVAELLARVGEVDGVPEYIFGDVSSVAVGPSGIVCVADRLGSTVRAYDLSGRFLGTIGGEGQGPGEFQFPNDLTFDAAGRLYVRDYSRISVFTQAADHAIPDSLVRTISLSGVSNPWSARGRIVGASYYYPNYLFRNGERLRYFYLAYDSAGATGDTVQVPPLPNLGNLGLGLLSDQRRTRPQRGWSQPCPVRAEGRLGHDSSAHRCLVTG